jgi:hypothetical protein
VEFLPPLFQGHAGYLLPENHQQLPFQQRLYYVETLQLHPQEGIIAVRACLGAAPDRKAGPLAFASLIAIYYLCPSYPSCTGKGPLAAYFLELSKRQAAAPDFA